MHSIEETRKCRVAYLKIDLARRQHEEFVMHLPNEHLSNNLVMKWLRDIPPIAEYRFFGISVDFFIGSKIETEIKLFFIEHKFLIKSF